jgi:hypothetical protein
LHWPIEHHENARLPVLPDRDGRAAAKELAVLCQELRRLHVSSVGEEDEDRLGTLPDDVLRLLLCRLDTRSTLSRQWSRLARELPTLEFKVSCDVLSERYSRQWHHGRSGNGARKTEAPC